MLRAGKESAPRLPLEIFGESWSLWLIEAAASAACPVDFVVATLLATASAAIGNARWPRAWPGWEEPPHLWCASIGNSGQGKSAASDIFFRHIVPAIEECLTKEMIFKSELCQAVNPQDRSPATEARFMESDLTIEKVASLLATSAPKGLLMVRDELSGWLMGMNRFNAGARAFWLEAYGGRPYRVDRLKSERVLVPNLVVAWHGSIQPDRLSQTVADADDGLLARFILFWPDPITFRRPRVIANTGFALSAFERLGQLEGIASNSLPHEIQPIRVSLCEGAAKRIEIFAQEVLLMQGKNAGLMASALGKGRGLVLRLSLVLEFLWWSAKSGSEPAPNHITEAAVQAAIRFVQSYAIPMARRAYGSSVQDFQQSQIQTLARWIVNCRATEVHVRYLQRQVRLPGLSRSQDIHAACQGLVTAGWLIPPPRGSRHGRARQAYGVQPGLWRGGRRA